MLQVVIRISLHVILLDIMNINITFLFLAAVDAAQQFEKQPEYNEVNPGQESRLTCKIFNKKGQCSWQKDNKVYEKLPQSV
jgi:hypothetical protein